MAKILIAPLAAAVFVTLFASAYGATAQDCCQTGLGDISYCMAPFFIFLAVFIWGLQKKSRKGAVMKAGFTLIGVEILVCGLFPMASEGWKGLYWTSIPLSMVSLNLVFVAYRRIKDREYETLLINEMVKGHIVADKLVEGGVTYAGPTEPGMQDSTNAEGHSAQESASDGERPKSEQEASTTTTGEVIPAGIETRVEVSADTISALDTALAKAPEIQSEAELKKMTNVELKPLKPHEEILEMLKTTLAEMKAEKKAATKAKKRATGKKRKAKKRSKKKAKRSISKRKSKSRLNT